MLVNIGEEGFPPHPRNVCFADLADLRGALNLYLDDADEYARRDAALEREAEKSILAVSILLKDANL